MLGFIPLHCQGGIYVVLSGATPVRQVLVDNVREEWGKLWRERIDDRFRAEGLANKDFPLLFVDRGTVIIATRAFRPLDLKEILVLNGVSDAERFIPPHPSVGGWGKFARTVLNRQSRGRSFSELKPRRSCNKNLQLKKGGRGWLHRHIDS